MGCTRITNMATCSAAAAALGLSDTTASSDGQTGKNYDPPYCYFENSQLKFNTDGSNTGNCKNQDKCSCLTGTGTSTSSAAGLGGTAASAFKLVTHGKACTRITNMATCSAAAAALGLSDTTASSDGQIGKNYDPPYCYFENSQ